MTTASVPFNQYESGALSAHPIQPSIFEMKEVTSAHQIKTTNSRTITPTKDKFYPISTVIILINSSNFF
jgi:hypothetical protein